jgi:hypothetical protein
MNAHFSLPLTAAALFALCAGSALIASQPTDAEAFQVATHIVELPTVTVRPAAEDLAFYQANKIVDLAAITVRPEPEDLAFLLAGNTARIVDLPVVTVTPSFEDMEVVALGAMSLAQQLAVR